MKNFFIVILAIAVLVLGFFLIKKNNTPDANEVGDDTSETPNTNEGDTSPKPVFGEESAQTYTETNETLDVSLKYPSFGNPNIDKEIKNFVLQELGTFKTENDLSYQNPVAKNSFQIDYRVTKTAKTTAIIFSETSYTGGAHGGLFWKVLNYTNEGERISIGSLFKPGTDYLAKLSEISKKKLKEALPNDLGSWANEGTAAVSSNFDAFYLKDESTLNVIFQPYQVAPWVAGSPEISINLSEFGEILNENF